MDVTGVSVTWLRNGSTASSPLAVIGATRTRRLGHLNELAQRVVAHRRDVAGGVGDGQRPAVAVVGGRLDGRGDSASGSTQWPPFSHVQYATPWSTPLASVYRNP